MNRGFYEVMEMNFYNEKDKFNMSDDEILEELDLVLHEIFARHHSNNCVNEKLLNFTWYGLCDYGKQLFERLKE